MASSASGPKQKRLEHALHNERVCVYLAERDEFADWVITTAFYAAVHFVEHKLFPLTIKQNGSKFKASTLAEYYRTLDPRHRSGKHAERQRLVEERHRSIADKFSRLRDLSQQARYFDYSFQIRTAERARVLMTEIKAYCTA